MAASGPPSGRGVASMLQASGHRFAAGTTYAGAAPQIGPTVAAHPDPPPAWPGAHAGAVTNLPQALRRVNIVGGIALSVSVTGAVCAVVALLTLTVPIASLVLLIISWVMLPLGFVLGISGAILPRRAKAASIAALVVAVGGGLASGYIGILMLLTMGHSPLPN